MHLTERTFMTPREIILANISHTGPDRIGLTFSGNRVNYMLFAWCPPPRGYQEKRWQEGGREYYDDIYGNIWMRMVGGCAKGEIHKPVLSDWSDLDTLDFPAYDVAQLADSFSAAFADNPRDLFKIAGIGGWIFDNARYLRRMDVYFMDMALYPDELKRLHAAIGNLYEQRIHAAGRAGADGIMIGEDMGTQQGLLFSVAMFRDYFKDLYTRLMGTAHDYGMKVLMHSCGNNREIVDDLLDCGVDCFQFDQPALYDMPALAAKLRERKAALWSPTDIQKILPTGDRDTIVAGTRRMCEIFDGGLIAKDYPDLHGIGVDRQWDAWAYETFADYAGVDEPYSS
jgi:hypothetical protein